MHLALPDPGQSAPTPNPEYFEGGVRMQRLFSGEQSGELELVAVFFDIVRDDPGRPPGRDFANSTPPGSWSFRASHGWHSM